MEPRDFDLNSIRRSGKTVEDAFIEMQIGGSAVISPERTITYLDADATLQRLHRLLRVAQEPDAD